MSNADHSLPDEDLPSADLSDSAASSKPSAEQVSDSLGATDVLHNRSRARWLWTAGAVVLVLAAAAAAFALWGRGRPSPSSPASGASGSGAASRTAAGSGATRNASEPVQPGSPAAGSGTTAPGAGTKPPAAVDAPIAPAARGSQLTSLSAPPAGTAAMLVVPKGFTTGRYRITFEPYGWGPQGSSGGRIVVRVTASQALDAGAKALARDFTGRNAMLFVEHDTATTLGVGGTYTGTMEIRPQGDIGMLFLVDAARAK